MVTVYVFLFYHFFVGPTGFRWRALYGDAEYPEGYEIHGIDISHPPIAGATPRRGAPRGRSPLGRATLIIGRLLVCHIFYLVIIYIKRERQSAPYGASNPPLSYRCLGGILDNVNIKTDCLIT